VEAADVLPAQSWLDLASYSSSSGWTGPGMAWETGATTNPVRVTVLDTQPMPAATNHFMRVRVSLP